MSRLKTKVPNHKEHLKKPHIFNMQTIVFPNQSEQIEGFTNEILIVASPMTVASLRTV